jgi:hypothetical protein
VFGGDTAGVERFLGELGDQLGGDPRRAGPGVDFFGGAVGGITARSAAT